jgi:sodium pump decarboxylase gamma subunit
VTTEAKFQNRDAELEFVFDKNLYLESLTVGAHYSMGEILEKAGMNTLIGMGTVFVVLIFISFIISLFKYISVYENRKKEQKEDTASVGVDNAIAQIVSNEEENVEDDLELIAVITAAIAASEGTSTDGLVVRSIRKVNNRRK